MSVIENLVRVFAPHRCIGCDAEEDMLLCVDCREAILPVPARCYRCKRPSVASTVCCGRSALGRAVVYANYQGLIKELVHRMKYERAQAAAGEIADQLSQLVYNFPDDVVLVHVPTATSRVRARGYDHAALLVRALARKTGLARARLLARHGQAHQVGADRTTRLRQLHTAFRPIHQAAIRGRHIVLVDDVLTTGATLENAAAVLLRAGAARVDAITFAQA